MHQNYGALRVVRMLSSKRATPGETNTPGRSPRDWLPEDGLVHVLTRRETALGRALNNDVILLDLAVSREHARLALNADGWRIFNLTEQNVVRVNGRPVPGGGSLPVRPQDILVLGNTMLQLIAPHNQHALLTVRELLPIEASSHHGAAAPQPDATATRTPLFAEHDSSQTPENAESTRYETPLPVLPASNAEEHWIEEEPESVLGAGIT
ncbi:MAG: FHA domain-containing protein, partial [Ktedonobacteraceae bacterium]